MEIQESQIEDILVNAPALTKKILSLDENPFLLSRQMPLQSGRLDLLYAYKADLLLVELKITRFNRKHIQQVLDYKNDLLLYQKNGRLINGNIIPYIVCTAVNDVQRELSNSYGIRCIDYNPEMALKYFYDNLPPIASFSEVKPIDIGIWNLHLIQEIVYLSEKTNNLKVLHNLVGGSRKTLYNKIKFAHELRLIDWSPHSENYSLTLLGKNYINGKDALYPHKLSETQCKLIRDIIIKNPYESAVLLGIASVVESVFSLSRNTYPVPMPQLFEYFTYLSGKYFDWKTEKAKFNATKMYSNYAIDLGLLAKTGDSIYITPQGFRFTIQMQMHKSLKLVGALNVS